jgi:LacI family transcriptional regulator
MAETPRVILFIENWRAYGRGLLCGIANYSRLHGPWSFYSDPGGQIRSLKETEGWKADGIIARVTEKGACILKQVGVPAVAIGADSATVPGLPHITADGTGVGRMGAEHLLERGFKNLAYLGLEKSGWSLKRGQAFAERAAEAGLKPVIFEKPRIRGRLSWDTELAHIANWVKSLPKPLGLMACNDDRARHAIEACRIAGVRIPDEAAILGADNDEVICGLATPPLSSISINVERAGYEAAELLDRLMAGGPMSEQRIVARPITVVCRQSTDVYAIEDKDMAAVLRHIRLHIRDLIQVDDIADSLSMSRRKLELHFRKTFGRSVYDEIRRVRIEQVARLLAETNMTICEIARELGYPSGKHISRYFRKMKGITPAEYRLNYGRK